MFESCIEACDACARACDLCASACLREEDPKMMAQCIANDIDCAALCRTAAGFMARGSAHAAELCSMCATMCDACASECARHPMRHCQDCAAACRRCADECRRMAASGMGVGASAGQAMRGGMAAH